MENNYAKIIRDNLTKLYVKPPDWLEYQLPAKKEQDRFVFDAFGEACVISPDGITLGAEEVMDARGIILSLYALHASPESCIRKPFKAYKEFPGTMPYAGAFRTHAERILIPFVERLPGNTDAIRRRFNGDEAPEEIDGDLTFTVTPLPKIHLCYIFYFADENFPASATCLYSANAASFLPVDALADVGEYMSKKMIEILT